MTQTREKIITSMCYTWRHDYGLDRPRGEFIGSGMSQTERESLWNQMAQVYDNNIAPNMVMKAFDCSAHDSTRTDWIEP
jgi:hypothetical protein